MKSRIRPLSAALAAAGLLYLGPAQANFVLGPFLVTQSATLRSDSSLGSSVVVGPGATPRSLSQSYTSGNGDSSSHQGSVPNGNVAFAISNSAVGTVPLASTSLSYGFNFTNASSNPFSGGLSFLVYSLQLFNQCTGGTDCASTDPASKAGAKIAITTTLPGSGTPSVQEFDATLGLNATALVVLKDDFDLASRMSSTVNGRFGFNSSLNPPAARLKINLGTVNPGESVGISYDTEMYSVSGDGLCNPPPITVIQDVCKEFGAGSGGSSVCIKFEPKPVFVDQTPFVCTSQLAQLQDPLGTAVAAGFALEPAGIPIPGTGTLVTLAVAALALARRRRP